MDGFARLFLKFFRWYCRRELRDAIEGDLRELHQERVKEKGKRSADIRFAADVLLLFRPGIIRPINGNEFYTENNYTMLKNYFKIGWRNLIRNKGYSSINIVGLAAGMAVTLIIGLWVFDELSFNTYFKNYDNVAQITKAGQFQGKYYQGQKYLPYPLIEELETNYAQNFKHIIPVMGPFENVLSTSEKKLSKQGMYMGEGAPETFSWDMLYGNWKGLDDLHGVMISESTAKAFFGDADPMGKEMKINNKFDVTVAGVFKDFPKNTQFAGLQFVQPWKFNLSESKWIKEQGWDNHFLWCYAEIAPNKTMEEVAANIRKAEMKAIANLDYMKDELQYDYDILLHPMKNWHLYSNYKEGQLQNGPIQFVWFIGSIGAFVLLLACINFMNLSTARSEKRAKEVGIRKAIGSVRKQLVAQFFSESFLVVIISFLLSLLIVFLALPVFNELSAKEMSLPLQHGWFWWSSISFIVITGLLSGSYPAIYLSSFKPVSVLKGTFRAGKFASVPRKVLVVVQFSVSVMLIVFTSVIYQQLMFVKSRPVGYTREGLLMIAKKSDDFNAKADVLNTELKATGVVSEVAGSGGSLTGTWSHNGGFTWEGKDATMESNFATLNVSPEFGKAVGWQFTSGRDFSKDIASDSAGLVLNESAVEYMKIKDPVGKTVHWTNRAWGIDQDFTVVGVTKDMIMNSPFDPVKPAIYFTLGYKSVLLVRISPDVEVSDALPKIEKVFTQVIPDVPFDYKFADEEFAAKFSNEERIGKLASVFTTLAIFISCLGLFGLASFVAEQRTKEIGIRKVMGASITNLWRLLSQEFVVLVIISCVIALPVSYYFLTQGLSRYEYKTDIAWWIFVAAGCGALVVTLATVSFQAIKAALTNPVKSLRSE